VYAYRKSPLVKVSRKLVLLSFAVLIGFVLISPRSNAQWWKPHEPRDFEECSESAERNATSKETRASLISECDAKFAGRRKPGGGYTYYDFMQNRHFDIAGPNPTPEEQKRIDEQYTAYLAKQRRNSIADAFSAKQQQEQLQQTSLRSETARVPVPAERPKVLAATPPNDLRSRAKSNSCAEHSFSCEWPRLSESINDLKKLFGVAPPGKPKRS
jgi:hypothetical protein